LRNKKAIKTPGQGVKRKIMLPIRATLQELEYLRLRAWERGTSLSALVRGQIYPPFLKEELERLKLKFKNRGR
jgi:hypothetical protein